MFNYNDLKSAKQPYVIAEIGSNHNGDIDLAKRLIDEAKMAGADCVKFQSWTKDTIFSKSVYESNYFLKDDYRQREDFSLESIVEAFSVSESELLTLKTYCDNVGIDFASTPFSKREADFLVEQLDAKFIKVASMDLSNIPFLRYLAKKGRPVVLSTGLSTLSEVDMAIRTLESCGCNEIVLLHCVSIYPPQDHEVNLNNIDAYQMLYKYPVGFSDHTIGLIAPIMAMAKGIKVLEKHFTLDKEMFGWDHKVSADPQELRMICEAAKRGAQMLGVPYKVVFESQERLSAFRRSIVVVRDLPAGYVLSESDIDYKRPGDGIAPSDWEHVIGRTLKCDVKSDQKLDWFDLV